MIVGILGLAMLYCIINEIWWVMPFLVLGVEISTGFAGSITQWIASSMNGDE